MKNLLKVGIVATGLFLSSSIVNAQQKFAHINSSELLQSMPEVKKADADMDVFKKKIQTDLETMGAEYEKKGATYVEKQKIRSEANKDVVDKELQTLGSELQDLEKRISEAQQKAQQDVEAKNTELFNPILKRATDAVNAVGKEKGYAYIFDTSQPSVIYFGGGDNILEAVKAKLNITVSAPAAKAPAAK